MRRAILAAAGATALSVALAGCGSTSTTTAASPVAVVQHTPGMVMPDGSTMGAMPTQTAGPSPAALMVCSDDVRGHIQQALRLSTPPAGTGSWSGDTYTCRYELAMGPLVLSVHEAKDEAGTTQTFTDLKRSLGSTRELVGLTPGAYGNGNGIVVLRKDNDVLQVDTTGLPAVFGPEKSQRGEFAYQIASDVLGCWTGDE